MVLTSLDPIVFLHGPEYAVIGVKRAVVETLSGRQASVPELRSSALSSGKQQTAAAVPHVRTTLFALSTQRPKVCKAQGLQGQPEGE